MIRQLVYSPSPEECGRQCGIVQDLFFKVLVFVQFFSSAGIWRSYIQKANFLGSQKLQIILEFKQKVGLRMRKQSGLLCLWSQHSQSSINDVQPLLGFWLLTHNHCIFLTQLPYCCKIPVSIWLTHVANLQIWLQNLKLWFLYFSLSKKQKPQVLFVFVCMLKMRIKINQVAGSRSGGVWPVPAKVKALLWFGLIRHKKCYPR